MLNRIYTRTFDPYDIYDELKWVAGSPWLADGRHQSNHAHYPTDVRVVLHLQDVRILALGVLVERPTWCVNDSAHLVLHPPMLRRLHASPRAPRAPPRLPRTTSAPAEEQHNFIPLVRSTTGSSAPNPPSTAASSPPSRPPALSSSPSMFTSFGDWMGRARRLSLHAEPEAGPSQSRTGERDRRWSLPGLTRSRSHPNESTSNAHETSTSTADEYQPPDPHASSPLLAVHGTSPRVPTLQLMPALPEDYTSPTPPAPSPPPQLRVQRPYTPLIHPTPAYSHRLYPNYTPYESEWLRTTSYSVDRLNPGLGVTPDDDPVLRVRDFRADHEETSEIGEASSGKAIWGTEGMKVTEWEPESEERRRWAGSMMYARRTASS